MKDNLLYNNPFTATVPRLDAVTEKYRFIPTSEFIQDMMSMGYALERTQAPRKGLGLHSMVFSHPSLPKVDGLDIRLLATNSHDATSAFRLHIQVGVGVCANVLVAFIPGLEASTRIVHRGYAVERLASAVDMLRNKVGSVTSTVARMQATELAEADITSYAMLASQLRDAKPFRWTDLAVARHAEQASPSVWNVFNRIQESLIKGGYGTLACSPEGGWHQGVKARAVTAVREKIRINLTLWKLAESFLNTTK